MGSGFLGRAGSLDRRPESAPRRLSFPHLPEVPSFPFERRAFRPASKRSYAPVLVPNGRLSVALSAYLRRDR
jgi:hypothetical protein